MLCGFSREMIDALNDRKPTTTNLHFSFPLNKLIFSSSPFLVTTSGDGDGESGEKEKEKEKEKDKDKDPKKHLDPFERNGGKSIPLQLKALNECLLGHSFVFLFFNLLIMSIISIS